MQFFPHITKLEILQICCSIAVADLLQHSCRKYKTSLVIKVFVGNVLLVLFFHFRSRNDGIPVFFCVFYFFLIVAFFDFGFSRKPFIFMHVILV